mgnify:CR=1 FL=1
MGDNRFQAVFDKIENFNYEDTLKNILSATKKPNILVCGGTGVGKSSLINYLFNEQVAEVGNGAPVTSEIRRYASASASIVLYDTVGYEAGETAQKIFYEKVIRFVQETNKGGDVSAHIHLIWYCISTANKRLTNTDVNIIKTLSKCARLCVVLTQVDEATEEELNEMKQVVGETLPNLPVFSVSIDERIPAEKLGWDTLVRWSMDNLDEGLKLAFAQSLDRQLDVKRLHADGLIKKYVLAAGAAVATPLPMTDSAALIAIQTTMATHIFSFWGIDKGGDRVKNLFVNVIVANMGRMVSRTLLKFVPGVGSIASFLINGSVATSFTYAFGKALNEICYQLAQKVAKGKDVDVEAAISFEVLMQLVEKFYKPGK